MELKHFGAIELTVRHVANHVSPLFTKETLEAKFHLIILADDVKTKEEALALFEPWAEQFGGKIVKILPVLGNDVSPGFEYDLALVVPLNTRREFAMAPMIIRKALQCGYEVATVVPDESTRVVRLSKEPDKFWQMLALAQAFYQKS